MMQWLGDNWFNLLSSIGIFFAAWQIRADARARRISNLLAITSNYRETWEQCLKHPDLFRILDAAANVQTFPVTPKEELFLGMVFSQMSSYYQASKSDLVTRSEGSRKDMAQFLALPIPKAVWSKAKPLQNEDFVAFIESGGK